MYMCFFLKSNENNTIFLRKEKKKQENKREWHSGGLTAEKERIKKI